MCQISNQLKFCTCSPGERNRIDHGWILHRFVGEKEFQVLGSVIPPSDWLDPAKRALNEETLLSRLNDRDAFDVDLKARNGDRLEVFFNRFSEGNDYLNYVFELKSDQWIIADWEPFDLENRFKRLRSGKVDLA